MKGVLITKDSIDYSPEWDPTYVYDLSEGVKDEYKPGFIYYHSNSELDDHVINLMRSESRKSTNHLIAIKALPFEMRELYNEIYFKDLYKV